jgi:hypothetical protein
MCAATGMASHHGNALKVNSKQYAACRRVHLPMSGTTTVRTQLAVLLKRANGLFSKARLVPPQAFSLL